jgi:predicted pyridoxine 5'-phosphate oxidase superfamily flavin-nucleotide-binding protein
MGISMASVFLSNEVVELATKYKSWHKLTANENQSAVRPASQTTTGCSHIYLVKMRNKIRDSLKAENGSVHRESRQGRPGISKDLDPHNKANQLQRVQAVSTVVKDLRSASPGFSLKPESRPSAASVDAEQHNPKVAKKEK